MPSIEEKSRQVDGAPSIEEKTKELETAISLDDKNPYAYYYAGLAYYKSGNGEKAIDDLKMFLQLAPDAAEAPKAEEIIDSLC
jgi:regulator of sirC expression with transglutaminase-like and TPR domain